MASNESWLMNNGGTLAAALDAHRDVICTTLTARLAAAFPMLCYDPNRSDSHAFHQQTLRRTPHRLHSLIQASLRLRSLAIVEREYRWAWPLVQRYGVTRQHLIAQVYWYFEVARSVVRLEDADRAALNALEISVVQIVERATIVEEGIVRSQRGRKNGHSQPAMS